MEPKTIVAIKSCHSYAERRRACLSTWLQQLDWADYTFLVGRPAHMVLDDCLMCDVSDDFKDIAPKIAFACRYALDTEFDYMFVCDDDTYVQPERLRQAGKDIAARNLDYVGWLRTDSGWTDSNKGWPYAQGSAYWLSARAMRLIAESPLMVSGVIDDGAVGRVLAGQVPFVHDWRYHPGPYPTFDTMPHPNNEMISCHKCPTETMRLVHRPWIRK